MSNIEAFLILAVIYYIGEFVGTRTKASVPSVFVIATLFLIGYWTFFPSDIVVRAGLGPPLGGMLVVMFCITHMGTIISIRQLMDQWKIVLIALAGISGMILACWYICIPLVGRAYVVAGLPPLTGGIVAATMMNSAALEKGLVEAAVLAIAMYAVQGFVGYPLTAFVLKREGRRILAEFRAGRLSAAPAAGTASVQAAPEAKKALIPAVPEKYMSTALILAKLMLVIYISNRLAWLSGGRVNQAVITLILGIIFTEIGFLDKSSLNKANSYGFLMYVLMIFVFAGLKDATPQIITACIGPMAIMIAVGVSGLAILSIVMGKILGVSWSMAFGSALTALYGFPPNVILTEEAAKALADTPEEKQAIMDNTLPQMIVGGFVTVTITSVIVAGVFVNLL